jgi:hypothetical protein
MVTRLTRGSRLYRTGSDRLLKRDNKTCVTYRPIARQRLGKHIPVQAYARNRTSITMQRTSQHTSLAIQAVFSVGSVQRDYKEVFGIRKQ